MKKLYIIVCLLAVILSGCTSKPIDPKYDVAVSSDGSQISFNSYGKGDTALIFIHGWSCDSRYWGKQIEDFAKDYRVITIDLAGHGHSSSGRKDYTILSFADDVKAVMDKEGINRAILVGHSFAGDIVARAAQLMPKRVVGIVGIDTLHNVAEVVPQEQYDKMYALLEGDFLVGAKAFVGGLFLKDVDPGLLTWVSNDMSSAPRDVALSAFSNYIGLYVRGEGTDVFKEIDVPVISINSIMWPTDYDANKKSIKSYDLILIEGAGHFPMIEKPDEFNKLLAEALEKIGQK